MFLRELKSRMHKDEGTNKSCRIRIENRDHTFTVRMSGLCASSHSLGVLTEGVWSVRADGCMWVSETHFNLYHRLTVLSAENERLLLQRRGEKAKACVPIIIPNISLANTFTVKEPCFMRVLAELTNCYTNQKHACKKNNQVQKAHLTTPSISPRL